MCRCPRSTVQAQTRARSASRFAIARPSTADGYDTKALRASCSRRPWSASGLRIAPRAPLSDRCNAFVGSDSHHHRRSGRRAPVRVRHPPHRTLDNRRLPPGRHAGRAAHTGIRRGQFARRTAGRDRRHPADVRRRPAVPSRGAARGAARGDPGSRRAERDRDRARRGHRSCVRMELVRRARLRHARSSRWIAGCRRAPRWRGSSIPLPMSPKREPTHQDP